MQNNSPVDGADPAARGFAQSGVRLANERAVLTLIALNPGASNAALARLSGLGPQTTSRIVSDLEARALVLRGEVLRGRRGQPATPLYINPEAAYVIGVEIGWRHFEVLLLAMSGETLTSVRRSYDYPDIDTIFAEIGAEIATIRAGMSGQQTERLIGIGVAGPAHFERRLAQLGAPEAQVERWRGLDIAGQLSDITGLCAEWANEGDAGCWTEFIAWAEPRPAGLAYFRLGTFIASGMAIDGVLREGSAVNLDAILVSDSAGCPTYVHDLVSIFALQQRLEASGATLPQGNLLDWDWEALEPHASLWLDEAGRALAAAVVNTSAVIALDLAVIDGVMPRPVVEHLLARVEHHLGLLPESGAPRPAVSIGKLGGSAAATGAAQLVLFHRFFSRAWNLFVT